MKNGNFMKWLAFAFPYLANLLHQFIMWFSEYCIGVVIPAPASQEILILLNSLAILFGIATVKNYVLKENSKTPETAETK